MADEVRKDGDEAKSNNKRTHAQFSEEEASAKNNGANKDADSDSDSGSDSDDSDMGPQLPSAGAAATAPKKKRRVLPHQKLYVSALPTSKRYAKSLMHKEQLSFLTMTPGTDFLITTSEDGVVKFWKKVAEGIEFVKQFSAHQGAIASVSVSRDGRSFATAGRTDRTIKIFDVPTFDLLSMIALGEEGTDGVGGSGFHPKSICWVHNRGSSLPLLAVSDAASPAIHIYDGRGSTADDSTATPIHTISSMHRAVVNLMAYNEAYDCVVSTDVGGMVEYWRPNGTYEKPDSVFRLKSATSLFEFKKAKTVPVSLSLSPSGHQFATFSLPDRKVRVFDFATGKLARTYDESLRTAEDMQQAGTALQQLETVEFGRRLAAEHQIDESESLRNLGNVIFDESGHFVLYGSMLGVKVVNTYTNQVVRLYGADEPFRPLQLALYQGQPQKKGVTTVAMAASSNPLLQESEARDPILVATGVGKQRFYMFTNQTDIPKGNARDVLNERPTTGPGSGKKGGAGKAAQESQSGNGAVIHTTYGDVHIRLFPGSAPKAVENFVTHAKRGYYNNTIFHRVIRKFMIQGGDPLGDGTGGDSIWGRPFPDEFSSLRHDKPYTVSMANAGPDTNGSQFFITTEKTPWLDNKHTIFGRAYQGMDVLHRIESVPCHKERPTEDIKILSIDIL